MRLIDAENLGIGKANPDAFERKDYAAGWNSAFRAISEAAPTIDPETLPIVRQLREELDMVTAERDAAVKTIFDWSGCAECKQWDGENEWCKKHDREADAFDGCDTPEWRGPQKEEKQ